MDQMTAELGADSLVFAITPTTKVVYCTGCAGAALDDPSGGLASWSDADFIGSDLTDFINRPCCTSNHNCKGWILTCAE